jgi:hypothetical protein
LEIVVASLPSFDLLVFSFLGKIMREREREKMVEGPRSYSCCKESLRKAC